MADDESQRAIEKFVLQRLLLEKPGGELFVPKEQLDAMLTEQVGWAVAVLVRPTGVLFKLVSPERRLELLAQGLPERN